MPLAVPHRMRRSFAGAAAGSRKSATEPARACMSSTSSEACQKNRYKLIVVPKTPITTAHAAAFSVKCGQNVRSATWRLGT